MITLAEMRIIMQMMQKHCYLFAKWAIEQGFTSKDELDEAFKDEFKDCEGDIEHELWMLLDDALKAFLDEEQEDYDDDEDDE